MYRPLPILVAQRTFHAVRKASLVGKPWMISLNGRSCAAGGGCLGLGCFSPPWADGAETSARAAQRPSNRPRHGRSETMMYLVGLVGARTDRFSGVRTVGTGLEDKAPGVPRTAGECCDSATERRQSPRRWFGHPALVRETVRRTRGRARAVNASLELGEAA